MSISAHLFKYIDINPKEFLAKGTLAKKISMDKLQPFCRDIPEYEIAKFSGGAKFRNSDTIMARITPCLENGKTAMVNILEPDEVGFGSTEFIVFRAKEGYTDPDFVYYLVKSSIVRDPAIKSMVGSSGRQRVQIDVVQNLVIPFPSLSEQRKIASILKSLDDKIALNTKINDNLYAQARAIKKHWVTANENGYKLLPLAEIAEINPDTYSLKEAWEYVNYLDTSNITNGFISNIQRINPSNEKLPSRARRKVITSDVLFSTVRPNQSHFGIVSDPLPNMLVSTGFAVIRSKNPLVCNELIYLCLTERDFVKKMQQLAEQSTSTYPSIKPSDLGACEIPCPKDEKSTRFLNTLESLFALIAANFQENNSLTAMRDALLPKLMSGELDVSAIEL